MEKALVAKKIPYKAYFQLTKPGIIGGNAVSAIAGYLLAAQRHFSLGLFLAMLSGLSLIVAAACVGNNYIDIELDGKMERTKGRALVKKVIEPRAAALFGIVLALAGTLLLGAFTPLLTLGLALFGLIFYVAVYSPLKYRTHHGTVIGSLAGAIPPLVGYTSVTGHIDKAALLLFFMVALWQMPHFFAIALYRLEDYRAGAIPVYPLIKGVRATKAQMVIYTLAFAIVSLLLGTLGMTTHLYFISFSLLGGAWTILAMRGFKARSDKRWARFMFLYSLVVILLFTILVA